MTLPWMMAFAAGSLVVLVLCITLLGLVARIDPLLSDTRTALDLATAQLRVDGLQRGEFVGNFVASTLDGEAFSTADLTSEASIVLFLSSECEACAQLLAGLEGMKVPTLPYRLIVASREHDLAERVSSGDRLVIMQPDAAMASAFESHRTPHVFVVDRVGRVLATGSPNTWDALRQLVDAAVEGGDRRPDSPAALVSA